MNSKGDGFLHQKNSAEMFLIPTKDEVTQIFIQK